MTRRTGSTTSPPRAGRTFSDSTRHAAQGESGCDGTSLSDRNHALPERPSPHEVAPTALQGAGISASCPAWGERAEERKHAGAITATVKIAWAAVHARILRSVDPHRAPWHR